MAVLNSASPEHNKIHAFLLSRVKKIIQKSERMRRQFVRIRCEENNLCLYNYRVKKYSIPFDSVKFKTVARVFHSFGRDSYPSDISLQQENETHD